MCAIRDMAEGSVVGALDSADHEFQEAPVGTDFSKPHEHRAARTIPFTSCCEERNNVFKSPAVI